MIYVGVDPSYSKTGLAYFEPETKTIIFKIVSPDGSNLTYKDKIYRALDISYAIVEPLLNENCILIMEEPLITSMKSSALGTLSGVLASSFLINNSKLGYFNHLDMYTINPSVVSATNKNVPGRTRKNRKKISQEVVIDAIERLEKIGYNVYIHNDKKNKDGSMKSRKLTSDEAEAFIMIVLVLRHLEAIPSDMLDVLSLVNKGMLQRYEVNKLN